jgi:hypothetical protein
MQVRMSLHIPLQFAMLALAAWHVPMACRTCYPHMAASHCAGAALGVAVVLGCVVPTLVLRASEKRARTVFGCHVAAEAGMEPAGGVEAGVRA